MWYILIMDYTRRNFMGLALAAMLPSQIELLAQETNSKSQVNPIRKYLENKGYEILDEKVVRPKEKPIIIFAEEHTVNFSIHIGKAIEQLCEEGIVDRIGLENKIGKQGENLDAESVKFYREKQRPIKDEIYGRTESNPLDVIQDLRYQQFSTQKHCPAYGLEEEKSLIRGVMAADATFLTTNVLLAPEWFRKEEWPEQLETLKRMMKFFNFPEPENLGKVQEQNIENGRRFKEYLTIPLLYERNDDFLKKMKPGDAIVMGVAHVPDLVQRYDGNVLVLNASRDLRFSEKESNSEAYARYQKVFCVSP
jgi:hypothetical protein